MSKFLDLQIPSKFHSRLFVGAKSGLLIQYFRALRDIPIAPPSRSLFGDSALIFSRRHSGPYCRLNYKGCCVGSLAFRPMLRTISMPICFMRPKTWSTLTRIRLTPLLKR
jgi:hypothetical protein